jgi:heat shock protein HslJ
MKKITLLLPFVIALAACARPATDKPDPTGATASDTAATSDAPAPAPAPDVIADELPRYHWRLHDANDASGKRIDALFVRADKPVTLDFAEGRVGVTNTCNRMGGTYTVDGGTLAINRLVSTMMACSDPRLMALDREAGARLEGRLTASFQTGDTPRLTLTTATGDVMVFAGGPTASTRYGGEGEAVFLEVAAQTRPCSHPLIPDKQCLQVREIRYDANGVRQGADGEFQNFYDAIEGYTHEPGVRNVLRVKRYQIKNPPADASSQAYVLDMVVESETAPR